MIFYLTILIAFLWLGIETSWLSIRLPAGPEYPEGATCEWRLPDDAVTDAMKQTLICQWKWHNKWSEATRDFATMSPLCGWGYAYQFRDFEPEYQIELLAPGSKYTIRSNSSPHLRDAFRVYRNPQLKVKLPQGMSTK